MSDTTAPRTRAIASADSVPTLPRHIKLRHDAGRGRWILLAPERVFEPDDTAVEVLKLVDGARTVRDIAGQLATEFNATITEIEGDIVQMVQDLADKGVLRV
ncbi:MAG: pyrroloquinoline quinone biosynthesis peptide chaperone PqqD [Hyphomicrobiaceae bacterium]|nr:pyrroloquinoline quinone biosynthesis peptide chaperone PqqD [Hyphomicrobiaceae bacterium]